MGDDRVLSQSEIDALLSGSAPAPKPAAAVSAAAAPPKPVAAAPAPPAAKPVAVPQSAVKVAVPPPAPPAPKPAAPVVAPPVVSAAPPPPAAIPAPAAAPASVPTAAPQIIQQGMTQEQVTNLCRKLLSEETGELAKQMVELTIKVNNYKKRIDHIDEKINEIAGMMQQSPAIDTLAARIEELQGMVLNARRRKSDEEHIRDEFHCVKCHSEKLVAVHVKCTSCGTENWMGWFPNSQQIVDEEPGEHY
jgi:hypothetical protein